MTDTQANTPAAQLRGVIIRWTVLLAAMAVFALWATCRMRSAATELGLASATGSSTAAAEPKIEYWTCTMHVEIQQPEPGECPICGMELVAKYEGSDEPGVKPVALAHAHAGPSPVKPDEPTVWYLCTMPECNDKGTDQPETRCPVCGMKREKIQLEDGAEDLGQFEVKLGERARRLAEVATAPVAYRRLFKRIRTVGKVTYDETRHKMVAAWVDGRIDKLFADYTGMRVSKDDHLVEIYSPKLVYEQDALLNALAGLEKIKDSRLESSRRSAERLVASARRNLELLGLRPEQIDRLLESGQAETHVVIYAPLGGTIVHKAAMEGMYVKTGDIIYEIADLTHVWLMLDLYEADLPWVRTFQEVRVTAQSLPGEIFSGRIVFVDPVVDRMTRTIKVRVNLPNPDLRLKPEMFVDAEIEVAVGADGRAAVPAAPGEYACPMHPWETADEVIRCPICEMELVPVTTIPGYAAGSEAAKVLSVPREAVLQTGERAMAYLEISPGVYRGAEVQVGLLVQDESGDEFYPVFDCLKEGQLVVTRGNFAIDSQMQIAGKPSLFNPPEPTPEAADANLTSQNTDEQTLCPVMGMEIDRNVFVDHRGVRIYFCCKGCDKKFKAEPEKYIPNLPEAIQDRIRRASSKDETTVPGTQVPNPAKSMSRRDD